MTRSTPPRQRHAGGVQDGDGDQTGPAEREEGVPERTHGRTAPYPTMRPVTPVDLPTPVGGSRWLYAQAGDGLMSTRGSLIVAGAAACAFAPRAAGARGARPGRARDAPRGTPPRSRRVHELSRRRVAGAGRADRRGAARAGARRHGPPPRRRRGGRRVRLRLLRAADGAPRAARGDRLLRGHPARDARHHARPRRAGGGPRHRGGARDAHRSAPAGRRHRLDHHRRRLPRDVRARADARRAPPGARAGRPGGPAGVPRRGRHRRSDQGRPHDVGPAGACRVARGRLRARGAARLPARAAPLLPARRGGRCCGRRRRCCRSPGRRCRWRRGDGRPRHEQAAPAGPCRPRPVGGARRGAGRGRGGGSRRRRRHGANPAHRGCAHRRDVARGHLLRGRRRGRAT